MENQYTPDDLSLLKCQIDEICDAIKGPDKRAASRELSLAVTNLEQARMWINEHQRLA